MKKLNTQEDWVKRAREILPGGGFGNFDPNLIISHGKGSHVWDEDGNRYIDYLIGSGPMILGHGHPEVLEEVFRQLSKGMTFFANNSKGIELAEIICQSVKCCEQIRYVTSGGEADMYAIRLARAYTGKNKILKFEGGYHGMSAEAQMSLAPTTEVNFPLAVPDSGGIPPEVANQILIAPFNDLKAVESILNENLDIAAIITEPLQRIIPPQPGFLEGLRMLCDKYNALLIFDEIVTGFRLALGGAQERYGVIPDICTLGKVIGGGFPLASIGANKEIMKCFDKTIVEQDKWLMQLGTLSGNPLAAVAGLKTIEILSRPTSFEKLNIIGLDLQKLQSDLLSRSGIKHKIIGEETIFEIMFSDLECTNYRNTKHSDKKIASEYNRSLRKEGILKASSKFYPSLAITDQDLSFTKNAVENTVRKLCDN